MQERIEFIRFQVYFVHKSCTIEIGDSRMDVFLCDCLSVEIDSWKQAQVEHYDTPEVAGQAGRAGARSERDNSGWKR